MKRVPDSIIRYLDNLWERKVKDLAGYRCEMGGQAKEGLDAHHIIPRIHWWTRWNLMNGFCVSREMHNTKAILEWLRKNDRRRYNWIMRQKRMLRHGQKPDLNKILRKLEAA